MAREYAQIKLAIWADDDWRELSPQARYLYLTLLTSPTLSHCGVADWRPARIGSLNGMSIEHVCTSGAELVESLHLVIDKESEEVLIRSFIRNDGLMKQPRMAVSMANAHAAVASKSIRGVIVHELIRLRRDFPDLAGWGKEKATHLLSLAPVDPSTYPLGKGSFGGPLTPGLGETLPSVWGSPTPSPTPSPATAPRHLSPRKNDATDVAGDMEPDGFDEFWSTYGKKVDRKKSTQKYRAALKKPGVTPDLLITAAREYVTWERANNEGGRYIVDPSRWLHGERWNDEHRASAPQSRADGFLTAAQQLHDQQPTIGELT